MLFASICNAQAQNVSIVEKLADGSYVVAIDNVEHRAITGAKAIEIAKDKVELIACRETEGQYKLLVELANKDVTIANQKAQIHETNFRHAMQMYTTERELRQEASQFIPHGKVGGFGGKMLDVMDSVWFQGFIKGIVPIYTAWRTSKQ